MVHSSNRLWYLKLTLSQNWRRWEQITVTVVGRELANNVNRELVNCRYQTYCLPVLELRFPPGQRTSYFKTSVQKIYICIYILNVCRYFLPAFLLLTRGGTSVWAHCRTGLTKQIFFVHVQVPNIRWEERKKKKTWLYKSRAFDVVVRRKFENNALAGAETNCPTPWCHQDLSCSRRRGSETLLSCTSRRWTALKRSTHICTTFFQAWRKINDKKKKKKTR